MSRINNNISATLARNRLQSSNKASRIALARLSTGLRINSGSDAPAGLIASEALRSEITSLSQSINNTRRAGQIIRTADSALGQVSNLLIEMRGLVVEVANGGSLSADEIAANQLQVNASLEAINRIAQATSYQGQKLLDGSLDFFTSPGAGASNIRNVQIDQANLGRSGRVAVALNVATAATRAALQFGGFGETVASTTTIDVAGVRATGAIEIQRETTAAVQSTTGAITTGSSGGEFTLTAKAGGAYSDAALNSYNVVIATNGSSSSIAIDDDTQTVTVTLRINRSLADIATALAGHSDIDFASTSLQMVTAGDQHPSAGTFGGGAAAIMDTSTINIEAAATGAAFNGTVTVTQVNGAGAPTAVYNAGVLTVTLDDTDPISMQSIADAINDLSEFTATRAGAFSSFDGNDPSLVITDNNLRRSH